MEVLNPRLYKLLEATYGEVLVSNEGQRFIAKQVRDPIRNENKTVIIEAGEQYRVNCPHCGDTRNRLYISHRWNTKDDDDRVFGRWLMHCFNEDCFHDENDETDWERIQQFEESLKPYINKRAKIVRKPEYGFARQVEVFKEVTLPGVCVPLNTLPETHEARRYIADRKFSADELTKDWNVQYCEKHEHPYIRNRIIIPIYNDGKLVGWQARAISENHDGPKYFTMPGLKKANMLFNGDRARHKDFGVVVEGVFDAFRVGPERAVALLGKSMNSHQQTLVHRWWGGGAVCLLLDPDAIEDMERISKLLSSHSYRWGAFSVMLPENNDPADMNREDLWEIIAEYARNRGIKLVDCPSGAGRKRAGMVSGQ